MSTERALESRVSKLYFKKLIPKFVAIYNSRITISTWIFSTRVKSAGTKAIPPTPIYQL